MARKQKRTKEVDNVRSYIEGVAKNLVDKLYGPQGPAWGTKLSEIEALCLDIREVLSEEVLDLALQRQAAAHEQQTGETFRVCPSCQRPLNWDKKEVQERIVETDAGEAEWSEPEGYCRRCRRSFFPSVPKFGD
jgi:uncharacterized protein YbaR (Trm112 family)